MMSVLDTPLNAETSRIDEIESRNKEKTIDKIRQRYGESAIIKGSALDTDIGIYAAPSENEE